MATKNYHYLGIYDGFMKIGHFGNYAPNFIGVTSSNNIIFCNEKGEIHRNKHPAVIGPILSWYKNGLVHREDGPAIIYTHTGSHGWWLAGVQYAFTDQYLKDLSKHPYNKSPEEIKHIEAQWT